MEDDVVDKAMLLSFVRLPILAMAAAFPLACSQGNSDGAADARVHFSPDASSSKCPLAWISVAEGSGVAPPALLHLEAQISWSLKGEVIEYAWSVDKPPSSTGKFLPDATSQATTFNIDVPGTFVFHLTICDADGNCSCEPEYLEVQSLDLPRPLNIELTWSTPGDPDEQDTGPEAGSDMDLHFLHPDAAGPDLDGDGAPDGWFDLPYDCFWFNPHPEWGSAGIYTDDPVVDFNPDLDRGDADGPGPDLLSYEHPLPLKYRLGVHYWNDHGYGPAAATVRIYSENELLFEAADVELQDSDMWHVAIIDAATGDIEPILDQDGKHRIVSDYHNPYFFQ